MSTFVHALLLTSVLVLAACAEDGPAPLTDRVAHWKAEGDAAFSERSWDRAIEAYQNLFALLDPVPARRDVRAVVAFRIGRGHAALARQETSELRLSTMARYARIWLREALALRPALHQVWFERAQLLELERVHPQRDEALVKAYRAYVAGTSEGAPGDEEAVRVRLAQTRLKELVP